MTYAPIALFIYNRADHFLKTFEALCRCPEAKETDLYLFADGAKDEAGKEKVEACRKAARAATADCAFHTVHITEAAENKGLAASVITGVSAVMETHGRAIVLEDDCVVSPHFLRYMNAALKAFERDARVGAIAGFTPRLEYPGSFTADLFTCYRSCSWGWATWANRWQDVDWELRDIDAFYKDRKLIKRLNADGADRFIRLYRQTKGNGSSWSVRFGAHLVKRDLLTVYPRYSYVKNIGCDETGVHSKSEDASSMDVDLAKAIPDPQIGFVPPDAKIDRLMKKHYSGGMVSDIKRFAATQAILLKGRLK